MPVELSPLTQLRIRWFVALLLCALILLSISNLIQRQWHLAVANRWIWAASAMLAVHLSILWWCLDRNYRPDDGKILPSLGYGNVITLTRGLLVSMLAGFLLTPEPLNWQAWIPSLLYSSAALLDYLDGYVARITGHTTVLGEILDMEFDGIGILVAIGVAILYGQVPYWYLPLGLGRQLFLLGIWIRQQADLPVSELPPSENRRAIAGFQMGFIAIILWPVLRPPITTIVCVIFAIPLMVSFVRDWLVVSNVLRADSSSYNTMRQSAKLAIEMWGAFICRITATSLCIMIFWHELPQMTTWDAYVAQVQPALLNQIWRIILLAGPLLCLSLLIGLVPRIAALFLLFIPFTDLLVGNALFPSTLLLVTLLWVVQFGGGYLTVWEPENMYLYRRAGE